jgi:hypothetical protein
MLVNLHKLNLHMFYMWQCAIDDIIVANNDKWLQIIIRSKDGIYIWVYTSSI